MRASLIALCALFGTIACGSGSDDDASGTSGKAGGTGGGTGVVTTKQAFVSYAEIEGDAGLEGADAACNDDAKDFFYGRSFSAWFSTSTVNARDRVGAGPWFIGSTRLGTVDDLAANQLGTTFNLSPTGSNFATGEYVWTGTASGGVVATATCSDWSSKDIATMGEMGQINYSAEKWTASTVTTCDHGGHVYCLERDSTP